MKRFSILAFALAMVVAAPASANCIGTGSLQTCFDSSGNSYTVNRLGNTTYLNGYNAGTGSTWSQNSTTLGNTTFHNGYTNGNSWNATNQQIGNTQYLNGTNSQGQPFSYTCGIFGCN